MPARESPWTNADVKRSVDGLRAAAERPRTFVDDPLERIAQSRANLAEFWSTEAAGFSAMWASIPKQSREALICTNSPHMAKSASDRMCVCGCGIDMTGSSILIPELIVENLVRNDGKGSLPEVMNRHATADHQEQEYEDLMYLRQFHRPVQDPNKMYMMVDLATLKRGQCMEIKDARVPGVF